MIWTIFYAIYLLPFLILMLFKMLIAAKKEINKGNIDSSNYSDWMREKGMEIFYKSETFNIIFSALVWIFIFIILIK